MYLCKNATKFVCDYIIKFKHKTNNKKGSLKI